MSELFEAGVDTEELAEYVATHKRFLFFSRPASMKPLAKVWRLGELLLDTEANLWSVGRTTRAAPRGRLGYQSLSLEDRRDIAAAALRGGYAAGTTVNFDAEQLPLSLEALEQLDESSPLGVLNSEVRVRWRNGAPLEDSPTLANYLSERIDLLRNRLKSS